MMKLKKFINKTYRAYSSPEFHISELIKILENKGLTGKKILDIGTKDAPYIQVLKKIGAVTTLNIENFSNADLVGDAHRLPFKDDSFDVVSFFMVLEHLYAPWLAFKECYRVMKAGGYLLITVPQYWHAHNFPNDYYRYTKSGIEYLCTQAELKVVYSQSMGGPFLVLFHVIELNLQLYSMNPLKKILYILLSFVLDKLDQKIFNHADNRKYPDSVGWAVIAEKST